MKSLTMPSVSVHLFVVFPKDLGRILTVPFSEHVCQCQLCAPYQRTVLGGDSCICPSDKKNVYKHKRITSISSIVYIGLKSVEVSSPVSQSKTNLRSANLLILLRFFSPPK